LGDNGNPSSNYTCRGDSAGTGNDTGTGNGNDGSHTVKKSDNRSWINAHGLDERQMLLFHQMVWNSGSTRPMQKCLG